MVLVVAAVSLALLYIWLPKLTQGQQPPIASCPEPSIVYVYANEDQKNAADTVTSTFKTVLLNYYNINVINTPVCSLPAQSIPVKLRVYPSLLLRGQIPSLKQFTTGRAGEYEVITPLISAVLAYYSGVNVTFGVSAEAIVLESTAPFAKLNVSERSLREALSQIALAEITNISRLKPEEIGLSTNRLPTVVFKSDYNLSEGVPYIVKLRGNIYGLAQDQESRLAEYLNIGVYEIRAPPPVLLERGVSYGSAAPTTLYILEDYHCPFCAAFHRDLDDHIASLVKQGKLKVVFVDLVVHPEVAVMHAFTKCLYNLTGNAEVYFSITRELYALFSGGVQTNVNHTKAIASKYISAGTIEEAQACAENMSANVQQYAQQLANEGFTATPTLVFWNASKGEGLVVVGCLQAQPCITQEQFDSILTWLGRGG